MKGWPKALSHSRLANSVPMIDLTFEVNPTTKSLHQTATLLLTNPLLVTLLKLNNVSGLLCMYKRLCSRHLGVSYCASTHEVLLYRHHGACVSFKSNLLYIISAF